MSDRDALLAAIRATPEDDTPRLVFADWLDEHEPDTPPRGKKAKAAAPSAWAALIRAECELPRLEDEDAPAAALLRFFTQKDDQSLSVKWDRIEPELARMGELRALANRLRAPASKAMGKRASESAGLAWAGETHRGFPKRFRVTDGGLFATHLPRLIGSGPRVSLELHLPLENPDELVLAGLPKWCRALGVVAGYRGHRELIAALSRVPETVGIRALHLDAAHGLEAANAILSIASSPHWAGLRELTINLAFPLPERDLVTEAVGPLFRAPHLRTLRRFRLKNSVDAPDILPALSGLPELRELDLTGSGIGDAGAAVLANSPALANLRYLDLESNGLTGRGASALIASPHLTGLTVLHLNYNPVRNLDRAALASAPTGGLRLIGFHGARLTVRDVSALTASPRLSELVYFDADDNNLPAAAFVRLVRGFGDRAPAILYLTGNNIGDAGVEALTTWPAAANIDALHLNRNTLSTAAAKAIAACPHLRQLTHFCANCAHPAGRKALKDRFGAKAFV